MTRTGAAVEADRIFKEFYGVWQRFRRKWAICRVGEPLFFRCIFTRHVSSITYRFCAIVQPSHLRSLSTR
jgi:hypothetical protein